MTKVHYILTKIIALAFIMTAVSCCEKPWQTDHSKTRKVMLLYSAGHNSLRNYLLEDIGEMKEGWMPGNGDKDDILLVYTHTPVAYGAYGKPSNPYLIRLYHDPEGQVVSDTLITYPEGTISASAGQLGSVLGYVKEEFPAKSYGMIFSSHATGYLPPEYYSNPEKVSKSIGQDLVGTSGNYTSYEIELREFAEAIPMKLDYLLFDACLMGGVEVAYELMGKCGKVGFSQAEVLAEGLGYKTLAEHLLKNAEPDPQTVCENFFRQYNIQTGVYKSATISLVDCDMMSELASVCSSLFGKYRSAIYELDPSEVQGFGGSKQFFYDLADIVRSAGASDEEMARLQNTIDKTMIYKNSTGQYYSATDGLHAIEPGKFSGLTMYLPSHGRPELNSYYKSLGWNKTTGLVE